MGPLNSDAVGIVIYPAEGKITARPLGEGEGGERIKAECGGCIGEQVEGLYQLTLDLLDLVADTLRSRAEIRRELERHRRFL
jgi:hypothetical protein